MDVYWLPAFGEVDQPLGHGPAGVLDSGHSYLGRRSAGAQDGKVLLNGIPIYLKTVLDQGYWPESNLTPPSDQAIQDDIRMVKELGFNGVRKHQKVEDPRFLYWADRMGLLVAAEMANAYLFNEDAIARMTREWIEVVARDYNRCRCELCARRAGRVEVNADRTG